MIIIKCIYKGGYGNNDKHIILNFLNILYGKKKKIILYIKIKYIIISLIIISINICNEK